MAYKQENINELAMPLAPWPFLQEEFKRSEEDRHKHNRGVIDTFEFAEIGLAHSRAERHDQANQNSRNHVDQEDGMPAERSG